MTVTSRAGYIACVGGAVAVALMIAGCAARPGGEARAAFTSTTITARAAHGHAAPGKAFVPDTLVRVASVSKLVTTIGMMRLVEAGTLELDRDVSSYLGWILRNPAFPDAPITLRQLVSHTSGLIDDGDDYAVPLGQTLRASIGRKNWSPHAPGTWFHYTNYNYPVVASVMERVTGERFDRLMARLVLTPLRLDACYNWTTCADASVARAAILYDVFGKPVKDDLRGHQPECAVNIVAGAPCDLSAYRPGDNGALFSPQGGLRISVLGLATIGRLLLADGSVDGVRLLSSASVAMMRTPQWRSTGANGDTEEGLYCALGAWAPVAAATGVPRRPVRRGAAPLRPFGGGVWFTLRPMARRRLGGRIRRYGRLFGAWTIGLHTSRGTAGVGGPASDSVVPDCAVRVRSKRCWPSP